MGKLIEKYYSKYYLFFYSIDIYVILYCILILKDKYVKVLRLFVEIVIEYGLILLGLIKCGWF